VKEYILEILLTATVLGGIILYYIVDKQKKRIESAMEDLLLNMPGGIFEFKVDESFTIISSNDTFLEIIGYTKEGLFEEANDSLSKIVFIKDLGGFSLEIQNKIKENKSIDMSVRMIKRDGSLVWVAFRGRLYRKNMDICVKGIAIDITDTKCHASGSFDHIFENISIGIFSVSHRDFSVKNMNPYFYTVMGIETNKENIRIDDIVSEKDIDNFKLAMKKSVDENTNIKFIHRIKNNSRIWIETVFNSNAHIGESYVLVTFIDVTQTKKMEQIVLKTEKEMSNVLNCSDANVIIVDVHNNFGIIEIQNHCEQIVSKTSTMNLFKDLIYKDDIFAVKTIINRTINEKLYKNYKFRVYTTNKKVIYVTGIAKLFKKTDKETQIKFIFFTSD